MVEYGFLIENAVIVDGTGRKAYAGNIGIKDDKIAAVGGFLIENAVIVDGTGRKAYAGNIGIKDDKIAAVGDAKGDAETVIDAKGLTALPGFIDAHSHADGTILWYPQCESYVMQGVTTFIGGQCGGSPAPLGSHEDAVGPPLRPRPLQVLSRPILLSRGADQRVDGGDLRLDHGLGDHG